MLRRTILTTFAAVGGLVLAACAGGPGTTPDTTPSPASSPTVTAMATPTDGETPTVTASAPAGTPSPGSSPGGGAGFDDPAECENEELGYEVAYPADWWANERVEAEEPITDIAACTYFAPEPVDLEPGTDDLAGVAIRFDVVEQVVEPGGEVIAEDEATVDGREARVVEFEPEPQPGFVEEGERVYRYEVALPDGSWLFATTDTINQDDARYEESRSILETMVETLEIED